MNPVVTVILVLLMILLILLVITIIFVILILLVITIIFVVTVLLVITAVFYCRRRCLCCQYCGIVCMQLVREGRPLEAIALARADPAAFEAVRACLRACCSDSHAVAAQHPHELELALGTLIIDQPETHPRYQVQPDAPS